MEKQRLQRPYGNFDTTDPEARDRYLAQPEIRQQAIANTERLLALEEQKYQDFLAKQKIAEEAEKRGKEEGKIETLMSLFLEQFIDKNVLKYKLNVNTDTEVEKKIQEVFPDFHLPAHI